MASIIPGFEYDIFISYRQKDNKHDGWVTEFVDNLKGELESTFKEEISVYFDINPHDGLLETHDVDASLKDKLKCLVFIPIISRTYCDPKSFAWEREFKAFIEQASKDRFGLKIKLPNSNVANRVLPIRIHDLDTEDVKCFEGITGGVMRTLDFIFKTASGVNRPLKSKEDHPGENLNKTYYQDQINKVALAIKEIIQGMKAKSALIMKETDQPEKSFKDVREDEGMIDIKNPGKSGKRKLISTVAVAALLIIAGIIGYPKIFKKSALEKLRSSDGRISVAVMPFKNMTNDATVNNWQGWIQGNLINLLSNSEELVPRPSESVDNLIQSNGLTNYASLTPAVASSISEKLGANVFVLGSIGQIGTTIRVYAQLIDTKTEEIFKYFQIDVPSMAEMNQKVIDSLSVMVKEFLEISKLKRESSTNLQGMLATCNSPEAYGFFIAGKKAFEKRDYPTVIHNLTRAIEIDTTFTYAPILLAQAYGNVGMYDSAKKLVLKQYKKRELMSPQMKTYTEYTYSVFFGTPKERIKYLNLLLEIDDRSTDYHYLLGNTYYNLYQYDKAIPEYEEALEINYKWGSKPWWVFNYTALGNCYHKTGQYKKEKRIYKKAEKDFPDDPAIYARLIVLELTKGNPVTANQYIEKYISLLKENSTTKADIARNMADIYSQADIPDKTEEYYRQALSSEPDNPSRMNNLAYFLINTDRNTNEGLEVVNTALKSEPDNYNYLHTKGWGLYKQGKYKEALEILQKSWDLRRKLAIYNHEAFLHLEEVKKTVAGIK
jgi:tetratricopeptide (TPR) repeat protein/TolB-like protein